jgi:hypothetical protein
MFCDVSTMDVNQRAYVMTMRAQIAKKMVASLSSRSSSTRNNHESGQMGMGMGMRVLGVIYSLKCSLMLPCMCSRSSSFSSWRMCSLFMYEN